MTQTVLVTGGTGFVGGWCIVELLRQGYHVRTTVRSLSKELAVRASLASAVESTDRLSLFAADLTKDESWDAAVAGCDFVLHVASPIGSSAREADALIRPAREGTLRVLRAATRAGVKRVVMTSSCAACTPLPQRGPYSSDETVWTDPQNPSLDAYRKSKVLAERAAWDFIKENPGQTTLTTILPAAIFGPVLSPETLSSVQFIHRLLAGRPPGIPRIGMCVVDVRDVAELHVRAMTAPEAAGERFIASGDFFWMREIAAILREKLGEQANQVPTRGLPDFVVRLMAWFLPMLRSVPPMIGRELHFSSQKARKLLGFSPRPEKTTIVECAESLLQDSTSRKA